ncbi:MAG: DUF3592 domain-containing protein [Planctomycetota bacterium]
MFLIVWILFWTLIVGFFDVITGRNMWNQIGTRSFESVPGIILSSEVESHYDSDSGTNYRPKIKYEYVVNNQKLVNDSIRYGETSSNDSYAKEFIDQHPVGSETTVFFDPQNPSDSVLETGIQGSDLFLLVFLTPFNIIMVGGWILVFYFGRRAVRSKDSGYHKFKDDGVEIRIQQPSIPTIAVFFIALLGTCFFSTFIVGFGFGFHVSLNVMLMVWSLVLGFSFAMTAWFRFRAKSSKNELVFHRFHRTLKLPVTKNRLEPVSYSVEEIESVDVKTHSAIDDESTHKFEVIATIKSSVASKYKLEPISDDQSAESLITFYQQEEAEQFANWISNDILKLEIRS